MPVWAIAPAAATVRSRFLGLTAESATPIASALRGVNVSIACIHLGNAASSPSRGRPRHA